MDLQLHGKTALVTGSTAGIGLAIASLLTREGATVIINGRTQERVDEAVHRMGASDTVRGIAADLSRCQCFRRAAETRMLKAFELGLVGAE